MSELTIKDFKSKYQPIGLSMELKSQGQSAYETGKIGGHTPLYTDEQIQDYLSNQPSLTIPKSIADILDNIFNSFTELQNNANSLMIQTIYTHYEPETTFYKWFNKEDNSYNISIIYLAGKALGVDLVKVGEG